MDAITKLTNKVLALEKEVAILKGKKKKKVLIQRKPDLQVYDTSARGCHAGRTGHC